MEEKIKKLSEKYLERVMELRRELHQYPELGFDLFKTAEIVKFLQDNKIDRKVLIVVDEKTPELIRATNNLRQVRLVSALYLNVFDILNADTIVLNNKSVPVITDWLNKEVA